MNETASCATTMDCQQLNCCLEMENLFSHLLLFSFNGFWGGFPHFACLTKLEVCVLWLLFSLLLVCFLPLVLTQVSLSAYSNIFRQYLKENKFWSRKIIAADFICFYLCEMLRRMWYYFHPPLKYFFIEENKDNQINVLLIDSFSQWDLEPYIHIYTWSYNNTAQVF